MSQLRFTRGKIAAVLIGAALVASFIVAAPSQASFPGLNGLIAYVGAGNNVFVVNPSNPVPTQVTNTGGFGAAQFNATGSKIVADGSNGGAGLVLLDPVAGSAVTVVPNTTGADSSPGFNPDASKLTFQSASQIFTINTAGSNRTNIVANGEHPEWSADGTFIAFNVVGGAQIVRTNPTGGNAVTLANAGAGCAIATPCLSPTVSPDSKSVAYSRRVAAGGGGLNKVSADGSTAANPTALSASTGAGNVDDTPSYAPDGTKLSFSRGAIAAGNLSTVPTDGSQTVTAVGNIAGVQDTSFGVGAGSGTGTGTGTGAAKFSVAAPAGKVKSGPCNFTVTASPAATGSVAFTAAVVNGKNTPVPASGSVSFANETSKTVSISVKHSRHKHGDVSLTLSSPTGGSLGTASATCDVGKK